MDFPNSDVEAITKKAAEADSASVYIALFGQPGAGKSSLINAIVGQPLAEVGVENDVTISRTDFEWNGLFLSDLPGYGTAKFSAATYREKFEIMKFDIFLCVTAGKLKEDDISFFRELVHAGKHCIFVRNKVDAEFQPGVTGTEMRARIATSIREEVGGDPTVIFTSCRTMQGLDELIATIMRSLSGVKRDRFLRSAAAYSKELLDGKRAACRAYAWYAASLSAVGNAIPFPGAGFTADVSAILGAMAKVRNDFNLTSARMDKFAALLPDVAPIIKTIFGYATKEGAIQLLKQIGTSAALAEGAKYIPVLGTAVAAMTSLIVNRIILNLYIDDCYRIADEMLQAHFQG